MTHENHSTPATSTSNPPGVPDDGRPDRDPIPPTAVAKLPFHDAAELRERWRALLGELGFSEPTLWFVFVERGTQLIPALSTLPLPDTPNRHLMDMLLRRLGETISATDDLSVACLLTRPGSDGLTARDRGWASMITDAAVRRRVPLLPLFRANDINVVAVPGAPGGEALPEPLEAAA
ncbi:hypothetical protein ACLQ3C_00535 [Gordonia sp. DT30]|uniref:hypothetical protein n=1 Tax=Gordonia sp. DT30 TaxID=3416546 RepID=UPI003CF38D15